MFPLRCGFPSGHKICFVSGCLELPQLAGPSVRLPAYYQSLDLPPFRNTDGHYVCSRFEVARKCLPGSVLNDQNRIAELLSWPPCGLISKWRGIVRIPVSLTRLRLELCSSPSDVSPVTLHGGFREHSAAQRIPGCMSGSFVVKSSITDLYRSGRTWRYRRAA